MDWVGLSNLALSAGIKVMGTACTINQPNIAPQFIDGVFDAAHVAVDTGQGVPVSSFQITLGIRLLDLQKKPSKLDTVQVNGTTYKVVDCLEDGEGGATLVMKK